MGDRGDSRTEREGDGVRAPDLLVPLVRSPEVRWCIAGGGASLLPFQPLWSWPELDPDTETDG